MAKKEKDPEAKGNKGGQLVPVLIILLVGVVIFFGVTFFTKTLLFAPKDSTASHQESNTNLADETIVEMDELLVNLAADQSGNGGYLKVKIALGISDSKIAKAFPENQSRVKDLVIETLRSKKMAEISSSASTEKLKKELSEKIKILLNTDSEINVYFTEYLVQ